MNAKIKLSIATLFLAIATTQVSSASIKLDLEYNLNSIPKSDVSLHSYALSGNYLFNKNTFIGLSYAFAHGGTTKEIEGKNVKVSANVYVIQGQIGNEYIYVGSIYANNKSNLSINDSKDSSKNKSTPILANTISTYIEADLPVNEKVFVLPKVDFTSLKEVKGKKDEVQEVSKTSTLTVGAKLAYKFDVKYFDSAKVYTSGYFLTSTFASEKFNSAYYEGTKYSLGTDLDISKSLGLNLDLSYKKSDVSNDSFNFTLKTSYKF